MFAFKHILPFHFPLLLELTLSDFFNENVKTEIKVECKQVFTMQAAAKSVKHDDLARQNDRYCSLYSVKIFPLWGYFHALARFICAQIFISQLHWNQYVQSGKINPYHWADSP